MLYLSCKRIAQLEDRTAVNRVAEMVDWYATKGGAVAEKLPDWPKLLGNTAEHRDES